MKNLENFQKIIDEIEGSRGHELDLSAYKLENSFKIMVVNYGYLELAIKSMPTFSVDQKVEKDKMIIEATRCFVNYLCSAIAFKDHCRIAIRRLYDTDEEALNGEYTKKIKESFIDDPLVGFIECLRNIYCHDELPPVGLQGEIYEGELKTRFVLYSDLLNKQSNFYTKGKSFVELQGDSTIDILDISRGYLEKTIFPWLMATQSRLHKDDLAELLELRAKAKLYFEE